MRAIIRGLMIILLAGWAGIGAASAERQLLAALLARGPAPAGVTDALTRPQLESCIRRAQTLDATERDLDNAIVQIERVVAEAKFLEGVINSEMMALGGYDEKAMEAFHMRLIRHNELARRYKAEFSPYQEKYKAFEDSRQAFESDCAKPYRADDLAAVKEKLELH